MGGGLLDRRDLQSFHYSELAEGWLFRQLAVDETEWSPVKKIPSCVHQDLIDNGKLEDPFSGFNELKAEWVGSKSWMYQLRFKAPLIFDTSNAVLSFDGLDTYAEVYLNGQHILSSSNMFSSSRVDVTEALRLDDYHTLEITFDPAVLRAEEIKKSYPDHKWICWNGDSARLAVRKAQYHWGWDWGPKLMSAGIWKTIRLEVCAARIDDLRIEVAFAQDLEQATVCVEAHVKSNYLNGLQANFQISLEGQTVSEKSFPITHDCRSSFNQQIESPALWMPAGYGLQKLYDVAVTLSYGTIELHSQSRKIGLRRMELIQKPDLLGKAFHFRVNGVDIFCGGCCWIPADSFLPNISRERYRAWLELVASGNQKMVRVWGGGVYEHDDFYDICDELGILVWQDFPFACGNYPCTPSLLNSIRQEAILNIRRLRNHPSLALLAGNNEDYQVAESASLNYNYSDKNPTNWLATDFPARYIYEKLLPDLVRQECPSVPYHPGSPWGDGKLTSDPSVGDLHQWNVWHGTQEKYQRYPELGGRFNSEFGMEALPHLLTLKAFLGPDKSNEVGALHPQSKLVDFHNKAEGHGRRLAMYLAENVRTDAKDLGSHIYLSQLIQCEALTCAYRGWRRQWGQAGSRQCGGALVWQLNDCWPVVSWSIVDYFLRPKPAFYAIKRCLAPIAAGVRRQLWDWSLGHAREPNSLPWEVWCVSSRLENLIVDVEISFWKIEDGKSVKQPIVKKGVVSSANSTTMIVGGIVDNIHEPPHILAVRVYHNGAIIARDIDWPQPLKYLQFPGRNVSVQTGDRELRVKAERPVKCLVFEQADECKLSDNGFDLAPNDEHVISIVGFKEGDPPPKWSYLGMEEQ